MVWKKLHVIDISTGKYQCNVHVGRKKYSLEHALVPECTSQQLLKFEWSLFQWLITFTFMSLITPKYFSIILMQLNVTQAKLTWTKCWSAVFPTMLGAARWPLQGHLMTCMYILACSSLESVFAMALLLACHFCAVFYSFSKNVVQFYLQFKFQFSLFMSAMRLKKLNLNQEEDWTTECMYSLHIK